MITSFIVHYPAESASPGEDCYAIVFHELGAGVSVTSTKYSNASFSDLREDSNIPSLIPFGKHLPTSEDLSKLGECIGRDA